MPIRHGSSATLELTVGPEDTAMAVGSGDVSVLATPRLVALFEQAAVAAVHDQLDEGTTTVGMRVQIDHLAPTGVGEMVMVDATLDKVEGRRLLFTVMARDHRGLVGAGKVTRVVVDRARFLDKLT